MAAIVAGLAAFGFGVTPNVSPRCTGAVDGFCWAVCAGIAAASAALGCGASVIAGFTSLISGIFSFASISIGFRTGFSIFGKLIFGASSFTSTGLGGSGSFGGGVTFTLGCGGGVVGKMSSVFSKWCCWMTCLAIIPIYRTVARIIMLMTAAVMNDPDLPSGSGSKPKLMRPG